MQQKEYPQLHEFGLGSLVGDFFQNVKDTVTGVAKAVAPIAPYVLPFIPGIGPIAKLGIGAGINLAAGQKPVDVAKNLAIQAALTGITGGFSKTPTKTILGFLSKRLKSLIVIPKETPNIIIAIAIFSTHNPSVLKFILISSMVNSCPIINFLYLELLKYT